MILSVVNHPDGVQHRAIYRSSSSSDKQAATLSKAEMKQARQRGARVANLKRRIATMERLVVECDRIAADLDREIRIEEDRTKIQNPAHTAYSFYRNLYCPLIRLPKNRSLMVVEWCGVGEFCEGCAVQVR